MIVCVRIRPTIEENDGKLETVVARNPFTFTASLSFTFKNEPRVQLKKYPADFVFDHLDSDYEVFETVGHSLVDMALAGGSGLFISYGQSNSGTADTYSSFS